MDTAALFEKPNGQPRVIGPTVKGKANLEGFERFRQAVDLRDQFTDPLEVKSRSLDGIRIKTEDLRFVYSVWRKNKPRTAEYPHPFGNDKVIENLVYQQPSKVINGNPPSIPPEAEPLYNAIIRLIRSKLSKFMSEHRLAEYLASIGNPEVEQARQREIDIARLGQSVVSDDNILKPRNIPPPPEFWARQTVSNLFSQFAEGFTNNANELGVQLEWIGIGTWKTPDEIVPEKHLEAWQLSRENLARGSKSTLDNLQQEAQLQQILRLIQTIPLARYKQNAGKEHKDIIQDLLIAYREQLIETIELISNSDKSVPSSLPAAIKQIETVLGIKHWVGFSSASAKGATYPRTKSYAKALLRVYVDTDFKSFGDREKIVNKWYCF